MYLCFERMNLLQRFLAWIDAEEHCWLQPKFFRGLTIVSWQRGQFRFISSMKNSTICPQPGHSTSKIASNPQLCVSLPIHFLKKKHLRSVFYSSITLSINLVLSNLTANDTSAWSSIFFEYLIPRYPASDSAAVPLGWLFLPRWGLFWYLHSHGLFDISIHGTCRMAAQFPSLSWPLLASLFRIPYV